MANVVFNIAKGRIVELYNRVKSNDPANSALILVPMETSGLESDATLIDKDDLAAVLSGTTNEQTTMGRKTLTDADLAAVSAPDDTNDRNECDLPTVTWTGATGNAISKILVCYDPDTTGGTDSAIIPLTLFDFAITPDGSDVQMTGATFFRAS
ncbi:MAG TPA: hypothetical protein PKC95_00225 [Thauera aminoaromatica]|nr:hypothetical protein [Thauera aminoaromatica]